MLCDCLWECQHVVRLSLGVPACCAIVSGSVSMLTIYLLHMGPAPTCLKNIRN